MIIQFLIDILNNLLSLLPSTTTLPSGIDSAISYFTPVWAQVNYIFPLDTLFSLLGLVIAFEASIFLFDMIHFVYNKIRGSGT